MNIFRFSPVTDTQQLYAAVKYIHLSCHTLCKQFMGTYLPVAGNIGIFCHYNDEYELLTKLREELTDASDFVYGKYFRLHAPIVIPETEGVPEATYTHLYIRKPDPEKPQVGDIDFFLPPDAYMHLKETVRKNPPNNGLRILDRPDLDLIELYDPKIDALAYVGDKKWQ